MCPNQTQERPRSASRKSAVNGHCLEQLRSAVRRTSGPSGSSQMSARAPVRLWWPFAGQKWWRIESLISGPQYLA